MANKPVHIRNGAAGDIGTLAYAEMYWATDTKKLYVGNAVGGNSIIDLSDAYTANSILAATLEDTPTAITIAEQQVVGRITGGAIKGLSTAEMATLLGYVEKSTYDANTILAANTDNTPAALTVATNSFVGRAAGNIDDIAVSEQTLVGRVTGGNITALTAALTRSIIGSLGITFFISGNAYTGENILCARLAVPITVSKVQIAVLTAPTGAALTVDVNYHATDPASLSTIFSTQGNRPSIAAGNYTDDSGTPDTTALAAGGIVGISIDAVGSTITGADLMITIVPTTA